MNHIAISVIFFYLYCSALLSDTDKSDMFYMTMGITSLHWRDVPHFHIHISRAEVQQSLSPLWFLALLATMNWNWCSTLCVQGCKQQFQVEATAGNKTSWRPCTYCGCMSQKRLHSHYSGRVKEFCRPFCMSQYTVLFYGVGGAFPLPTHLPTTNQPSVPVCMAYAGFNQGTKQCNCCDSLIG